MATEDDRALSALQHSIVSGKIGEAVAWASYFGIPDDDLRQLLELCMHMVSQGVQAAVQGSPEENSAALERLKNLFTPKKTPLRSVPQPPDHKEPA